MKYTSKQIQNILTSKTAIDGLDYITPIYHEAETALWIMEAMGLQADLFVKWVYEIIEQILPQTATWSLDDWEEEYGLPVHPNISMEQRRAKILNAVRTRAPMNPEKLEEILKNIFQIEKVKVIERTAKNTFEVELYEQFLEQQWQVIFQTIEKYKPAHLLLQAKSILETHFDNDCYVSGAVFRPVIETILPEIEDKFDFKTEINISAKNWNVTQTALHEMQYPYDFKTNMTILGNHFDVQSTVLPELRL